MVAENNSIPGIPILRRGKVYNSLDQQDLMSVDGSRAVARLSFANSGLVRRDLLSIREARNVLRQVPSRDLMVIAREASRIFLNGTLPVGEEEIPQTPDDYVLSLAATSGLPHSLIRMNLARLGDVIDQLPVVLKGLTRGIDLDVIDRGYGEQDGVPVSYAANTDSLGVILPSNSPAVNALWIPSVVLKIPVVLKPGREEPWTPWRLIQAFVKAGCPPEAFSFYPTGHDGSGMILRGSGRVMMFGDDATVAQYAADPRVEVHGAGHSKIVFGEDEIGNWREHLPMLVESVSANSGRSCINTSTIVVPRHGDAIAEALARELADIKPLAPDDSEARLSGFANPAFAEYITGAIDEGLETEGARDVSAEIRGPERHQIRDNMHYLLPTVIRCDSFEHPLSNREFLFPFVTVVEVPQADMLDQIGSSLVVTAVSGDRNWHGELLESPDIDRLNIGAWPTNRVQWNQPHEGNLFEFLYRRRSIHVTEGLHA